MMREFPILRQNINALRCCPPNESGAEDYFRIADNTARMCRRLPRTWRFLRHFHRGNTRSRYTRADKLREAGILARGGLMESAGPGQSAPGRYPRVASSIHLILVLAAIGGWAIAHKIFTDQLSATVNPNSVHFYVVPLLYEWLLFVLVVVGVRRSGASALMVLGEHLHSGRQVLRGIGIAVGFWIVAVILLSIFGWLLRTAALGRNVAMLPHAGIGLTLWIARAVTAGICEETIFRGYLQRQFMALTPGAPADIRRSAAACCAGY